MLSNTGFFVKQHLQKINNQFKAKNGKIESLNTQLKAKNEKIESLNNQLKAKNEKIESLNTQLKILTEKKENFDISDKVYNIIISYGFELENYNKYMKLLPKQKKNRITRIGIGDLLITILLLKQKTIENPIYINLKMIDLYFPNMIIKSLHFRCKLLQELLICNNISLNEIKFIYDVNNLNGFNNLKLLNAIQWKLQIPEKSLETPNIKKNFLMSQNKEYIIFHTKLRMHQKTNYQRIRRELKSFYKNYKTDYLIVLMGEQEINYNYENIPGNTIYNELKHLEKNNEVIDYTKKDIYNNLDFEEYINDIEIIKNAKANIIIGCGGQYVSALVFSTGSIITFWDNKLKELYKNFNIILDDKICGILRDSVYNDIHFYFNDLKMLNSSLIEIQKNTINFIRDNQSKNICIIIPHNGLGDNLNTMSMCNYLSTKYDIVIHCVCNMGIYNNMKLFYSKNSKIIVFPLNTYWKKRHKCFEISIVNFLKNNIFKYVNKIYALGLHNTNKYLIATPGNSDDIVNKIEWDPKRIPFSFYKMVNLSPDIFYNYINIPDLLESNDLYESIKDISYAFISNYSSKGINFNICDITNQLNINVDQILVINPNTNIYKPNHKFYNIANEFVNKPLLHYKKTIENSLYLVLFNSSFLCFAIQLNIKTDNRYYVRDTKIGSNDIEYIFNDSNKFKRFDRLACYLRSEYEEKEKVLKNENYNLKQDLLQDVVESIIMRL